MPVKVDIQVPDMLIPIQRTIQTCHMGTNSFNYIRYQNRDWLVSYIKPGLYKIVRQLTFSEACYIHPFIPLYIDCYR